jgi:hypothetical protein
MKLYITNLNVDELNSNSDNIHKYKTGVSLIHTIYSEQGIYEISKKQIYQLIPTDNPVENYNLNKFNLLLDTGYFTKENNVFQIPYLHTMETFQQFKYRLHDKSKVSLIIEVYKKDEDLYKFNYLCDMKDIYFEIDNSEKICDHFIQEDIVTFLSILNNVKNI